MQYICTKEQKPEKLEQREQNEKAHVFKEYMDEQKHEQSVEKK